MNRPRVTRLLAAAVAVFVFGAALEACGSDGPSNSDVAAQDRDVVAGNKVDKANMAKLKEALRVAWLKRARARQAAAAAARRARPRPAPARTVIVGGTRVSTVDVCAPVRRRVGGRAGRADRQWRLQQRQRALNFLNLQC
jgi:hypothetical protein